MSSLYSKKIAKVSIENQESKENYPLLHLYVPPFLSEEAIGAALFRESKEANLDTPGMRVNVLLFYTYLNKIFYNGVKKDANVWVGVHRDVRRSLLGNAYVKVIERLVAHDLLELRVYNKDGRFFPKGLCRYGKDGVNKSFQVPLHLLKKDQPWRHETCALTPHLRKKLTTIAGRGKTAMEKYRALTAANMNLLVLVDTPASRAAIDALFARRKHRVSAEKFIHIFNNFPFGEPVVDKFGARLHHEVVRLHKSLRPFLRFRDHLDQEMVELDLVASQPSFLANTTPELILKYAPECADAIPYFEKYSQDENYLKYRRLCRESSIYEYLRDEFNKLYGSSLVSPVTRDDAKNIYYNAAFSNYKFREKADQPESLAKTEARLLRYQLSGNEQGARKASDTLFKKRSYHLFKQLFGSIHQLFADLKELYWDFNPGKKHAANALLAQRIESGIVYQNLVKSLVNAGIERFTTTHDSLNVMKCDEPLARRAVMQALEQAGLTMTLKQKDNYPSCPVTSPDLVVKVPKAFELVPVLDMFEELDYFACAAFVTSPAQANEVTRTEERVGPARTVTVAGASVAVAEPIEEVRELPNPALMSHEEQIDFMLAILKRQEANAASIDLGF